MNLLQLPYMQADNFFDGISDKHGIKIHLIEVYTIKRFGNQV